MHICQHLQIAAWLHSPIDYAFIFNALHILWINSAMSIGTFDGCWPLFFWSDYSSRILFHIVLGHEMINNCICWRKTWISWIKYYNSKVGLVDSFHWQLAAWLHQLLMNSHSPAGQYYNLNPVNFRMSLWNQGHFRIYNSYTYIHIDMIIKGFCRISWICQYLKKKPKLLESSLYKSSRLVAEVILAPFSKSQVQNFWNFFFASVACGRVWHGLMRK